MKVLAALTAAFLFAASTQTSQAMPCGQYGQLVKNSMNNPAILPMQKQCYVAMAEYTCEECNGNMACMQSRGEIGPEESGRIMQKLTECAELMQLASGFMPKRRLPASLKEFDELGERVWKSPSRCTNQFCKKDGPNDMACTCLDSDTDASRPRRLKAWLRAIQNKKKCKYRTCRKVGPDGMTCQCRDSIPSTPWHHTHCVQQNEVNCEGTGVCKTIYVQICD